MLQLLLCCILVFLVELLNFPNCAKLGCCSVDLGLLFCLLVLGFLGWLLTFHCRAIDVVDDGITIYKVSHIVCRIRKRRAGSNIAFDMGNFFYSILVPETTWRVWMGKSDSGRFFFGAWRFVVPAGSIGSFWVIEMSLNGRKSDGLLSKKEASELHMVKNSWHLKKKLF